MNATVSALLGTIRLGEPVATGGLTLIPVLGHAEGVPGFVTLSEALAAGTLIVTEVDKGASVPELLARNNGDVGVLVLDGEELIGAKQNRVLNTSIYLAPGTEVVIPVSCTERGRWRYISERFEDSGHVAAHEVRQAAHRSVTASVRASGSYRSDQGRVWAEVDNLQARHAVCSGTDAMRDVYEQRAGALERLQTEFAVRDGQTGVFALWAGEPIGFDVVASPGTYALLHDRLVRSYALDALAREAAPGLDDLRSAKEWLVGLTDTVATRHDSPGDGTAYRFTGPRVLGSALVVDDTMLHGVFFAAADEQPDPRQARYPSARERRGNLER